MDVELDQFQVDLLESVREMSESYAIRASDVRLLQMQECIIAYVPSLELKHANASLELKGSDAQECGPQDYRAEPSKGPFG